MVSAIWGFQCRNHLVAAAVAAAAAEPSEFSMLPYLVDFLYSQGRRKAPEVALLRAFSLEMVPEMQEESSQTF